MRRFGSLPIPCWGIWTMLPLVAREARCLVNTSAISSPGRMRPRVAVALTTRCTRGRGGGGARRGAAIDMVVDSREMRFYSAEAPVDSARRAGTRGSLLTATVKSSGPRGRGILDGGLGGNSRALLDSLASSASPLHSFSSGLIGTSSDPFAFGIGGLFSHAGMRSTRFLSGPSDLRERPQRRLDPIRIDLTCEEEELFDLLRTVTTECGMKSTLRVAGGWVRDKILLSEEFKRNRASVDRFRVGYGGCREGDFGAPTLDGDEEFEAKDRNPSRLRDDSEGNSSVPPVKLLSVTVPVDIDIALDDKLGREFADELNQWLSAHGRETHTVGVVMKNPEKSKHLETATMLVNNYWIDFVNLRAEEYTSDSRIPDLMRIGTAEEDALRRDLTINSLFYNINKGVVEDMTGRGLNDLRQGIVSTPLPPLTTLLDDPLRVLRSVRFAARLRFGMEESLREAAADPRVKVALEQKVSRERIGSEIDLMLKSRDPVRAMRLLVNLGLVNTVFRPPVKVVELSGRGSFSGVFHEGLALLGTTHDHLCDCKANPPTWCEAKRARESGLVNGVGKEETRVLMEDEDARRLLWYASFLKPLRDRNTHKYGEEMERKIRKRSKKANRSIVLELIVDGLKRSTREGESIEKIMKAADGFTDLISSGSDVSALPVVLSGARVLNAKPNAKDELGTTICTMDNREVDPDTADDPVWLHCMEFRENCANVLRKVGPLWRAAFILSLCEQLVGWRKHEIEYLSGGVLVQEAPDEVATSIMDHYDMFAAAMMQLGLIGIWNQQPLLNGDEIKRSVLLNIPKGPAFRDVMESQTQWMTTHPGGSRDSLAKHLRHSYPDFV